MKTISGIRENMSEGRAQDRLSAGSFESCNTMIKGNSQEQCKTTARIKFCKIV